MVKPLLTPPPFDTLPYFSTRPAAVAVKEIYVRLNGTSTGKWRPRNDIIFLAIIFLGILLLRYTDAKYVYMYWVRCEIYYDTHCTGSRRARESTEKLAKKWKVWPRGRRWREILRGEECNFSISTEFETDCVTFPITYPPVKKPAT